MSIIVSSPDVLGGALVFKGTRVPVLNLFDYLMEGSSTKEFLKDFPTVSFEQVRFVTMAGDEYDKI
jgi:uncharacterized protein (DUF433 family)